MPTSINDAISALMQLPTEARQKVGMMLHGLQPSAAFNQQMMAAAKRDPVGMVKGSPVAGFLMGSAIEEPNLPRVAPLTPEVVPDRAPLIQNEHAIIDKLSAKYGDETTNAITTVAQNHLHRPLEGWQWDSFKRNFPHVTMEDVESYKQAAERSGKALGADVAAEQATPAR